MARAQDVVKSGELFITDFYGEREEDEIRIVLVGRTGAGKSATGNTLLGRNHFLSKLSGSSVTERCEFGEGRFMQRKLRIVDTPGLFDTRLQQAEITKEIFRCGQMSQPGPHIFLLVLRIDRFTNEEIKTFNTIFGEKMNKFAIIAFTHFDELEKNNTSIEEFIESSNNELKEFVKRCWHRYIAFNNNCSEKEKRKKLSNLMDIIGDIQRNNNGRYYTNEMYEEAEANLQRKLREVKRLQALKKAKEVANLESNYKRKISKLEESVTWQQQENNLPKQRKDETDAKLENIQQEIKSLNIKHDKELLHAREEERKRTENQLLLLHEKEIGLQLQQFEERFREMRNSNEQQELSLVEKDRSFEERGQMNVLLVKQIEKMAEAITLARRKDQMQFRYAMEEMNRIHQESMTQHAENLQTMLNQRLEEMKRKIDLQKDEGSYCAIL